MADVEYGIVKYSMQNSLVRYGMQNGIVLYGIHGIVCYGTCRMVLYDTVHTEWNDDARKSLCSNWSLLLESSFLRARPRLIYRFSAILTTQP